jgi:thiol-disulfide isomerase/thioredoxin
VSHDELIDPSTIDGGFVPVPRRDLATVELEGELVLALPVEVVDEEQGTGSRPFDTHCLDRTATVAWKCLDGTVSIEQLAEELREVFVGDRAAILADLVELNRTFGRSGLLEDVRPDPRPEPTVPAGPMRAPIGTEVDLRSLTHVAGRTLDIAGDDRHLLVKWSPGCGFCRQIAPDLVDLAPDLSAASVRLVLVASGSVEDNLTVLAAADLADIALVAGGLPVFEGLGTPSAYLLDGELRTASPLAMGAPYVVELVRAATGSVDHG